MVTRSYSAHVQEADPAVSRPLIVPVDASSASVRAVDLAIRMAEVAPSRILLVALLPDVRPEEELEMDPELVRALFMEVELGLGGPSILPPADEETRARRRFEQVLIPLKKRVEAAGIPVEMRLLRGWDVGGQLRRLLGEAAPSRTLVLSNPLKLYGPLRELTQQLWADPPCIVYVAGLDRKERPHLRALLKALLNKMLHRLTVA